ncbi:MAG TPA: redoxin domain-containing protein [Ktedonobacteraceae bacterium]|nr:redoxin domain-containing protein [Ktedonobacteraceae bacterium]
MAANSQTETKTLRVGDVAPDFSLKTGKGETWRLADFRDKKNVVLAFVPFAFSSVCSAQIPSYEAELERFKDYDTEVVSVSTDSGHALRAWAKSMGTSIANLSDFYPQGQVADLYGVRNAGGFSNRVVVLIDKKGIIRFIEFMNSPGDSTDNEALFEALRKL